MSDSTTPRPVPVTAPAQADVQDAPRYLGSSQGNWFARVGWRHLVAWAAIAFSVFPILFVVSAALNPLGQLSSTTLMPNAVSYTHLDVYKRQTLKSAEAALKAAIG